MDFESILHTRIPDLRVDRLVEVAWPVFERGCLETCMATPSLADEPEQRAGDDWRLMGQERYLQRAKLVHRRYEPSSESWEHDHCAFCQRKFSATEAEGPDTLASGYTTTAEHEQGAGYHWVCETCFADFADRFGWETVP